MKHNFGSKKKKEANHVLIIILIRAATLRCGVIAGHLPLGTLFDAVDAAVGRLRAPPQPRQLASSAASVAAPPLRGDATISWLRFHPLNLMANPRNRRHQRELDSGDASAATRPEAQAPFHSTAPIAQ